MLFCRKEPDVVYESLRKYDSCCKFNLQLLLFNLQLKNLQQHFTETDASLLCFLESFFALTFKFGNFLRGITRHFVNICTIYPFLVLIATEQARLVVSNEGCASIAFW